MGELALVLGFVYPILTPLISLFFAIPAACFHVIITRWRLPTVNLTRPSARYLYVSLMLGCALIMGVYADNALHGRVLVFIGVPLCACLGLVTGHRSVKDSESGSVTTQMVAYQAPL